MRARSEWRTSSVKGIGTAVSLTDISHEVLSALLLTSTLGAQGSALGAVDCMSDALAAVARFGGACSPTIHRSRAVAVGGDTSTAVLSARIGIAAAPWRVVMMGAGAWASRGLRAPARNTSDG